MRQLALAALVLCAAAGLAVADDAPTPVSDEAFHVRLAVGGESGRTIVGYIDESAGTGKGYDTAVLDLDGDGTPEASQTFGKTADRRTGEMRFDPKVKVEHDGVSLVLDLYSLAFRRPFGGEKQYPAYIRWTATKGDLYAWFINGKVAYHRTARDAAEADPIRLGGPFHFAVSTRTRGPEALVSVGLKDANGCTLRLYRKARTEVRPHFRLLSGDEAKVDTHAPYG